MESSSPFRILKNLGRSREIAGVLLKYGFSDVVDRMGLLGYLQWGRKMLRTPQEERQPPLTRAQRIRLALEELGPTFIKFGQVISTRADLVPPEIIDELSHLQESVPEFDSEVAVRIVEDELGGKVEDLYAEFDRTPLAAGSLAQVHRARHHDGTPLAVKIRRPNAVHDIERDIALLREMAILLSQHLPESEVFDPIGLVNQFARSITRELNFAREGRTQDEFSRLFKDDATLYVPKVFWPLTSEAVLTMEFIEGYRIQDKAELLACGLNPCEIARNGALIFMKMSFEIGTFHGDPHPGNMRIFSNGKICLLDYGLIGHVEEYKRDLLVDLFLSISKRDVSRAVDVVLELGQNFQPLDRVLLQTDVRDFIENYYGIPLERIAVGSLLNDFVHILTNHSIRYPAEMMLWIRAIITLEGIGRTLDPEFNLAGHLAPFIEKIVRRRYDLRHMVNNWTSEVRHLLSALHRMPGQIDSTLKKINTDSLKLQLEHRNLDHLVTELDRSGNRIVIGMVMSSLILASSIVIRTTPAAAWLTIPTFLLSSLLGIWLIYGIFRSGRL